MRTAGWQIGWRLVLALALAVAPWPPAAFAAVAAPMDAIPVAATQAMPCHDTQPATAPVSHSDTGCPDDCCPDPACDPTHCVVLHAGVAAPRLRALNAAPPASTRFALVLDRPPAPPVSEQLRPPIV